MDEAHVLEVLGNSGISFGTNDDTLVSKARLCRMLEIGSPEEEGLMISLGC